MGEDHGQLHTDFKIIKYDNEEDWENGVVKEVSEFDKNLFLTEGITKLWNLIANIDTAGYYSESNAYLGVGNGTTAEDASQTGLQGASTYFESMDTGYPQVSSNEITFYATFGKDVANFEWNEFTIVNATDDTGDNLDRKQSGQGTKVASAIWEMEVTLSIS